ncbi:MAG: hypothetical protein IBJ03_05960 [Gemmatimonadaceae bacterium]|nr:hypothetical protein [Gemmatimonadaceae bacterium]
MNSRPRILVVAATVQELISFEDGDPPFIPCACGVGPVDAAVHTTRVLAEHRPTHVLHVGIAGARRSSQLSAGTVVIGSRSVYQDLGVDDRFAPSVLLPDTRLLSLARAALPEAPVVEIGTSGRVGGTHTCPVEAMEGFAVLRACAAADVPAIEIRIISNDIEETDRTRWHFAEAFAATHTVTRALVREISRSAWYETPVSA